MDQDTQLLLILVVLLVLFLLAIIVFVLFSVFMKRKNSLLREQIEAEKRYERAIAETQIEIREETLRNISWELHDNIGQLLTLAKIKAQNIEDGEDMLEVAETIGTGLNELRALSKSINPEAINGQSLLKSLDSEVARFNRLKFLSATYDLIGDPVQLNPKAEIILFRIVQEFMSNTMKHSKASKLQIRVQFKADALEITALDDGVGFDAEKLLERGIGLSNIDKRAQLIGAQARISSIPGAGTQLKLYYPLD
ncbi:histidine kinase [Leeuwenhoekiella palythoae]|uniref:sensor histidine kinase n=1 Tax=Leeuwenhoekiella palythoae TaxID=573501 RepID=UPI000C5C33E8|nr:ATP-binding protein [Leeuwenhoekiella palythoae]MBH13989.1 histidine kinase [Leeuwenhoekiella sp.]UBZ11572.1 histidine kinase [Leeuwenhoekiella palythoae]HAX16246.1 histidine kinase [Leeuwenhoekiella sp.]HBO31082.1 histidine kinase [Leeuwenhoekiella sp.]|tara:strand:+ start:1581 stop:2339 length:759 start_codon:yes stop_codon:yes gene_type:complete